MKKFRKDEIQIILSGILNRAVSMEEVEVFLCSDDYLIDYDEMWQRVWEQYKTGDTPIELIPLETMLFRMTEYCVTPKEKLEDCLWLDIGNLWVYKEEIEQLFQAHQKWKQSLR